MILEELRYITRSHSKKRKFVGHVWSAWFKSRQQAEIETENE